MNGHLPLDVYVKAMRDTSADPNRSSELRVRILLELHKRTIRRRLFQRVGLALALLVGAPAALATANSTVVKSVVQNITELVRLDWLYGSNGRNSSAVSAKQFLLPSVRPGTTRQTEDLTVTTPIAVGPKEKEPGFTKTESVRANDLSRTQAKVANPGKDEGIDSTGSNRVRGSELSTRKNEQISEHVLAPEKIGEQGEYYLAAHRAQFKDADYWNARWLWERFLQQYPQAELAPEARYNLAIVLLKLGDDIAAREQLEHCAQQPELRYRLPEIQALISLHDP